MRFLLFSGHMIDKPGRPAPRFPPAKEEAARAAIRSAVEAALRTASGEECKGIAAAACGGDILFQEACRDLGVRSEIFLAIPVDAFEKTSVAFAGLDWVERYLALTGELPVHVLYPEATADARDEIWEKANDWMLKAASAEGGSRMTLIVLWDGAGGDGPGGTRHMVDTAERNGAEVVVIDSGTL